MSIKDGFMFWLGKMLAEIALPVGIFAVIFVAYMAWGLFQIVKAKLKGNNP